MKGETHVGLILVILFPDLDLTNLLLMKRPVGWVYLRPLGAVSSIERSDIFAELLLNEFWFVMESPEETIARFEDR